MVRSGEGDKDRRTTLPRVLGALIRTVQELLGHTDVKTTMIDAQVPGLGMSGARSALDAFNTSEDV